MTTRFEQIAAAFPLHAQRIAELTGPAILSFLREAEPLDDAGMSLTSAFVFEDTAEGSGYWWALAEGART